MQGKMEISNIPAAGTGMDDEVEWSLIDVVRRIVRGRWVVLMFIFAGMAFGLLIALTWPQWYAAQAVFLPPRAQESMSLGSGVGGAAGAASALMLQQDPSDMYLGMLGSRSVTDDVIDHVGLMAIYHAKTSASARIKLQGQSKFKVNKNSLISVDVTDKDPKLAASIANAYLEALYRLNGSMVASASAHRSAFLKDQLQAQKNTLDAAEVAFTKVEEKTGIVLPEGEAQAGLRATADLQASIGAAEARLSGVRMGATENNPGVIQARAELAELRAQLARQQASSAKQHARIGLASSSALPGLMMEYVQKMRDVKLNEALYESLTQQYEKARILSLDPGPQLQIVDLGIVPEGKAGPPRTLIVLVGIVLGFFAGLAWVLFKEPLTRLTRLCLSDPYLVTER
jgi:tyrosine-protein kinase Etk/Wzc